MKLTISRKLLIIYFFMALLTVLSSTYAILSLYRINQFAFNLVDDDFSFLNASKQISKILFDLESADKRYLILKDPSIEAIYWSHNSELKAILAQTQSAVSGETKALLSEIEALNRQHEELFQKEIFLIAMASGEEAILLDRRDGNRIMGEMIRLAEQLQWTAEQEIALRLEQINFQSQRFVRITMILSAISLIAGFFLALIITYNISRPLMKLKKATAAILEGEFDYPVNIVRRDEIGSLAKSFRTMREHLKILEGKLRDESPLTGLPGNRAIEEIVEKKFLEGEPFSLCHLDLDNFKPYADKYGYAWGSEVLKEVADILKEKHAFDNDRSFIGHIGGDDFIIIADPDRAEKMCHEVIHEFDRRIVKFFTQSDKETGFIVGRDRHGSYRKVPLMSLSIAVVTNNATSQFENSLDMAQKAAELKGYAKSLSGSVVLKLEELTTVNEKG